MKALRSLATCLAALALLAAPATAQQQPRQLVGQRVRITAPNITREKVVGNVTAFDTAQLVVHDSLSGVDHAFPLHSIQFMEISRGNTRGGSAGSRAGLLAFTLGGLGAIVGALAHPFDSVESSAAIGGGGGAALGALLGAAWGASTPHERWEWSPRPFGYDPRVTAPPPAPMPVEPTPAPPAPPPPPAPALR